MVVYAVNLRFSAWQEPETTIRTLQKRALGVAKVAVMNSEELAFITKTNDVSAGCSKIHELGPELVAVTMGGTEPYFRVKRPARDFNLFEVDVIYDVGAWRLFPRDWSSDLANGLAPSKRGAFSQRRVAAWRVSRAPRLEDLLPTIFLKGRFHRKSALAEQNSLHTK